MGNQFSNEKKDFATTLDFIASKYILSQNFIDMKNLGDIAHCNKLIVMTADMIEKNVSEEEIEFLHQEMKDGEVLNEMKKEKILYMKKTHCKDDDEKNIKKKRMCIGISKFYVKISHIFAAILSTVNPEYEYMDNGTKKTVSLKDKNTIPKGTTDGKIKNSHIGLCEKRLVTLLNKKELEKDYNNKMFEVHPRLCELSWDNLGTEKGIKELENLYRDIYDYQEGNYNNKTDDSKKKYFSDLKKLYKSFSDGEPNQVDDINRVIVDNNNKNIKRMSDIDLINYKKNNGCITKKFNKPYSDIVRNGSLHKKYTDNITDLMKSTHEFNNKLLEIIDQLFTITIDKKNKKDVIINKKLTHSTLDKINEKTKTILLDRYINCEDKFRKGVSIYKEMIQENNKNKYEFEENENENNKNQKLKSNDPIVSDGAVVKFNDQEKIQKTKIHEKRQKTKVSIQPDAAKTDAETTDEVAQGEDKTKPHAADAGDAEVTIQQEEKEGAVGAPQAGAAPAEAVPAEAAPAQAGLAVAGPTEAEVAEAEVAEGAAQAGPEVEPVGPTAPDGT